MVEDPILSFHPLQMPSNEEKTRNRKFARTHILKSQKRPELVFDGEIQWGIHRYEPWGEIESIIYPKIHWKTQFL